MKTPVQGLGGWVAFGHKIGDAAAIVARALELGCAWIAVREDVWSVDLGKRAHAAGLKVIVWRYDATPSNPADDVSAFVRVVDQGADGVSLDAETEWDHLGGASPDAARRFGAAFRRALPDTWIADAPWPWEAGHPTYPAQEFAEFVDARMPQAYWTEIGVPMSTCVERMDREWDALDKARPDIARPRFPIGVTYSTVHGVIHASDVIDFLDRYPEAPSLYSIEAMTDPRVAVALRERAERVREASKQMPPSQAWQPDGPAHPLGDADRAEQADTDPAPPATDGSSTA